MDSGLPSLNTPLPAPQPAVAGQAVTERKHSRLGIASFVIAVATTTPLFALLVAAVIMRATGRDQADGRSLMVLLVGLSTMLAGFMYLLGIGLGIAGIVQRERKRVFAVLGLVINIVVPLLLVALGIFGQAVKKRREQGRTAVPAGVVCRGSPTTPGLTPSS